MLNKDYSFEDLFLNDDKIDEDDKGDNPSDIQDLIKSSSFFNKNLSSIEDLTQQLILACYPNKGKYFSKKEVQIIFGMAGDRIDIENKPQDSGDIYYLKESSFKAVTVSEDNGILISSIISFLPNFSHKVILMCEYLKKYTLPPLSNQGGLHIYNVLNSSKHKDIDLHYQENRYINYMVQEYYTYNLSCQTMIIRYLELLLKNCGKTIWVSMISQVSNISNLLNNDIDYVNYTLHGIEMKTRSNIEVKDSEKKNLAKMVMAINVLYDVYHQKQNEDYFSMKNFIINKFYNVSYTIMYLINNLKTNFISNTNWIDINNQICLMNISFDNEDVYHYPSSILIPSSYETTLLDGEIVTLFENNFLDIVSKVKECLNVAQ